MTGGENTMSEAIDLFIEMGINRERLIYITATLLGFLGTLPTSVNPVIGGVIGLFVGKVVSSSLQILAANFERQN